jgi:hypothetical protein
MQERAEQDAVETGFVACMKKHKLGHETDLEGCPRACKEAKQMFAVMAGEKRFERVTKSLAEVIDPE